MVGMSLGMAVVLGSPEGIALGFVEGTALTEGTEVGELVGMSLGIAEVVGVAEGAELCSILGNVDGGEVLAFPYDQY